MEPQYVVLYKIKSESDKAKQYATERPLIAFLESHGLLAFFRETDCYPAEQAIPIQCFLDHDQEGLLQFIEKAEQWDACIREVRLYHPLPKWSWAYQEYQAAWKHGSRSMFVQTIRRLMKELDTKVFVIDFDYGNFSVEYMDGGMMLVRPKGQPAEIPSSRNRKGWEPDTDSQGELRQILLSPPLEYLMSLINQKNEGT